MKKEIIIFLLSALCIFGLVGCGSNSKTTNVKVPEYTLVNQSDYIRNGEKCQGYKVVSSSSISDNEILAVYKTVSDNDGYKYHTVWFYSSKDDLTVPFVTVDDETQVDGHASISK